MLLASNNRIQRLYMDFIFLGRLKLKASEKFLKVEFSIIKGKIINNIFKYKNHEVFLQNHYKVF